MTSSDFIHVLFACAAVASSMGFVLISLGRRRARDRERTFMGRPRPHVRRTPPPDERSAPISDTEIRNAADARTRNNTDAAAPDISDADILHIPDTEIRIAADARTRNNADAAAPGFSDAVVRSSPDAAPAVAVIVAVRNGEAVLPELLDALAAQSWPRARMRVIIADDGSTDATARVARAHPLAPEVVRVEAHAPDGSPAPPGGGPKKRALHAAIGVSDADFLLFTDADCRPEPLWVESMAMLLMHGADVVAGLSPVAAWQGWCGWLRAYEVARGSMLMTAAIGWDVPYMALGRNWGYRRAIYEQVGGLPALTQHIGGDDDLLFQRFVRAGARVATCTMRGARCMTGAPGTPAAYLRMRLRHQRVARSYRGGGAALLFVFEVLQFTAVVVAPLWLLFVSHIHPLAVGAGLAAKLAYDTRFLLPAMPEPLGRRSLRARLKLLALEEVHVLGSAITGVLSQILPARW